MPTVVPVFTLLLLAPGVAGATTGALAGAAIGGTLGLLLLVSVVVISLKYYRWRRSQFLGFRVKALTDASRRAIGDLHTALHLPAIIPGARGAAAGRAKSGLTRQGTSVRNWLRDGTRHSLHLSDRPVATKASSKGSSSKHTRDGGAAAAPGAAAEIGGRTISTSRRRALRSGCAPLRHGRSSLGLASWRSAQAPRSSSSCSQSTSAGTSGFLRLGDRG